MKCELKAADWKKAIKAVLALQTFGKEQQVGENLGGGHVLVTVLEDKVVLEAISNGAHLRKDLPAKTLRPGSACFDAVQLDKRSKYLNGELTIDASKSSGEFSAGKTSYDLPINREAEGSITTNRPLKKKTKTVAQVPFSLLKEAASITSFTPAIAEEELYLHLSLKKADEGFGELSLSGVDQYSCSSFQAQRSDVLVKSDFTAVLASDMLKKILQQLDGEKIGIRHLEDQGLVQFKSESFVLSYPTIDEDFVDVPQQIEELASGEMDGFLETTPSAAVYAADSVKVVSNDAEGVLNLHINKDNTVTMFAKSGNSQASSDVEISEASKKEKNIPVNQFVFYNFLKLIPKQFPLRVESWNNNILKMTALRTEDRLSIQFLVALSEG